MSSNDIKRLAAIVSDARERGDHSTYIVRAILTAIREPSEAVNEAAAAIIVGNPDNDHDKPLPTFSNAWRAGIDCILGSLDSD